MNASEVMNDLRKYNWSEIIVMVILLGIAMLFLRGCEQFIRDMGFVR